jgi:hypothetical protein
MDNPTLEGASAIKVFGGALVKLTDRGVVAERDFPLMRHLYEVVALERPLNIPWKRFFGGEPARSGEIAPADAQGRDGETRLGRHPAESSANTERTSSHG